MCDMIKRREEFTKRAQEILNKSDKNPDSSLFHYTNFNGLKGILESRQLWLTSHKYLNDPSEIEHGKNIIFKRMNRRINDDSHSFLIDTFTQVINLYQVFITSFCQKEDYLPAWRYYGDNGAGFAIGFKNKFSPPGNDRENDDNQDNTHLYKVHYDNQEPIKELEQIFNSADDIFPNWENSNHKDFKFIIATIMSGLLPILPRIKHGDYEDEHEWRFCRMHLYIDNEKRYHPELPVDRFFVDEIDRPHIPPFLRDFKKSIPRIRSLEFKYNDIETIYVGPRLDYFTAKVGIEKILRDAGISEEDLKNIIIEKSLRPFR